MKTLTLIVVSLTVIACVAGKRTMCHNNDPSACYSRIADKLCWTCSTTGRCVTAGAGHPCDDLDATTFEDACTVTGTCVGRITRSCTPCSRDSSCRAVGRNLQQTNNCTALKCMRSPNTRQRCCTAVTTPGNSCVVQIGVPGVCTTNGTCAIQATTPPPTSRCTNAEDCVTIAPPLNPTMCQVYGCPNTTCVPQYAAQGSSCGEALVCNGEHMCVAQCMNTDECAGNHAIMVEVARATMSIMFMTGVNNTSPVTTTLVPAVGLTGTWKLQPDGLFHGDLATTNVVPRVSLRLPSIITAWFGNVSCSVSRVIARTNVTGLVSGTYGNVTGMMCGMFDILCPSSTLHQLCLVFSGAVGAAKPRTHITPATIGNVCKSDLTCGPPQPCHRGDVCTQIEGQLHQTCDRVPGICVTG